MAIHQRVYPYPVPPTAPLVAPGSSTTPKRVCFCKYICWTLSLLFLLLSILVAIADSYYLVFQPELPDFSIDCLMISDLWLDFDMILYAKFDVKFTANNPNKKIGIYYEEGGRLSMWYTNTELCEGSLPQFYQGHQNKTVLSVSLTGQVQCGRTLMRALQEQQQTGCVPLDLKFHAPLAIKLGWLKLRKVRISGDCMLVVDSLSSNNLISIKASNCTFILKPHVVYYISFSWRLSCHVFWGIGRL